MAKQPEQLTIWSPNKYGLISDISLKNLPIGSLPLSVSESGALNVRAVGDGTGVSPDYENIKGNLFSNGFDQPVLQNRIFRINILSDIARTYIINCYDGNGNLLFSPATGWATTMGNITTSLATGITQISADLLTATIPFVVNVDYTISSTVTGTDAGYIQIEFIDGTIGVPYWDYDVRNQSPSDAQIDIIQEAIDPSMLGYWKPLGSNSQIGDLFQLWTTRRGLPIELPIASVTDNGTGIYRITTNVAHNLLQLQSVEILGSTTTADGVWIIDIISTTEFDLLGSTFGSGSTNAGTVSSNIYGYGNITVSVKDENTQTWAGYSLLKFKEANFSTLKQIDCRTKQKQDLNKALYFTDDYNNYRVFYYKGAYKDDGALVINGGNYEYGTIAEEILLDVSQSGFDIFFINQIQSGGGVRSGNWRYAVRFGTTSGKTFTNWGLLTNPVPVTSDSEQAAGDQFFGRPDGTSTPKQNVLRITNPNPGIFDKVQIAAINYLDGGYTGEVIGEYILTGQPTQDIIHTGLEPNVTDLDIGTLNNFTLAIEHGRNIELLNNRLIKSNLTLATIPDLSAVFEAMTYSIERFALTTDSVGSFITNGLAVGEYMYSSNVYNHASLMLNERYRWGFRVEFAHGGFSPTYWSRDIIINTDNAQVGCNGTALPDYDMTGGALGVQFPYSFFVRWDTPNLNQLVNGIPLKKLIKRIYAFRCKVSNPQVLASGVVIPCVSGLVGDPGVNYMTWCNPANTATENELGEFPFVAGINEGSMVAIPTDYNYIGVPPGIPQDFVQQRNYASFYAPDIFMGHTAIAYRTGDVIYNYGQPNIQFQGFAETGGGNWDYDYLIETDGQGFTPAPPANPTTVVLDSAITVGKGASATVTGFVGLFSKKLKVKRFVGVESFFDAPEGMVLYSSGNTFDQLTAFTVDDRGFYLAQYFRVIADGDTQYGAKRDSRYEYTGTFIDINDNTPTTFAVYEGDVFTQKSYFKNRYPNTPTPPPPIGFGQGISFYSQNRVNFQMRNPNNGSGTPTAFPASGTSNADHVQTWLNNTVLESLSYNEGYTIRNEIQSYESFDPTAEYQTDWGNVEAWSQPEAEGAVTDMLRVFLPLDINFEDYNYGYITDFKNENEEAIVVQQRRVKRAVFNSNAILTTKEGSEVITGDGAIMNQKGQTVTLFGSSNKWSIVQGKNNRGNNVLYGVNTDTDLNIWRYGYNGMDNLSEMQQIASFCRNNFRYIIGKDTPAHDEGICAFANQAKREVGWTFRGWKSGIDEWTEPEFHMEHQFDSTNGNGTYGDLIEVNGLLYGTTAFGGATNAGIIFSFDPSNGTFVNLFDFTFGSVAEGYSPSAGLVYVNSKLYGITPLGGANGYGTIFSVNIDGTGYNNEFDMALATGATGVSEMIVFNSKIYGMTSAGGANTFGVLFEYDYLATTYTDLIDFTGTAGGFKGSAPQGKLYTDGTYLYGMTRLGGANSAGVLFQYDLATYTVLHEFSIVTGSLPYKAVTKSGSKLYGTTSAGGANLNGTLFEFDLLTLAYTVLYNFNVGNAEPLCTPTISGNRMYGTTRTGGSAGYGTLWQYNISTNTFSQVYNFLSPDIYPRGQMLIFNNTLYGATVGTTLVNYGTIYSYSLDGYYNIGDVVTFSTTSFEEIPAFYVSLVDNNVSNPPPSITDPPTWELILTTDNRYYSFFTLIYSEIKDAFVPFLSPKSKIYWQYKQGYGDCRPVGNTGTNFEEGRGQIGVWWDDGVSALVGDSYFDAIINSPSIIEKTFRATRYSSDLPPTRTEYTDDSGHISYLNQNEFKVREKYIDSPIKRDSTVTAANPAGLNSTRTSALYGFTLIVRTKLGNVYNKVNNFVVTWTDRARNFNR